MQKKKDIKTPEDIRILVDSFYGEVRKDPLIGPVFHATIRDNWPAHLEKMYRFWETVLLDARTYSGHPFLPHAQMAIDKPHFETWLRLWHKTVDTFFEGTKADEARWRGDRMAALFLSKLDYYRHNPSAPLI